MAEYEVEFCPSASGIIGIHCIFKCYYKLQDTTVQHTEHLKTLSAVPSANWFTVAVKSLTTEIAKCRFPLDIRHTVRTEYVKFSTLDVNVERSFKTLVNS
jgi:hypothetical protein